jgi:hypothetical protein
MSRSKPKNSLMLHLDMKGKCVQLSAVGVVCIIVVCLTIVIVAILVRVL